MPELLLTLRFVLAGLLYAFLAGVIYLIWQDLRAHTRDDSAPFQPATLITEAGALPRQIIGLRPVTAIGRSSDNHVMIDDPFASANHAIVVWREERWWIEDLDSHNGTYVNGEPVAKPRQLVSGDRIGIGETILRFERDYGHSVPA